MHPGARAWYQGWRDSPGAEPFIATDWPRLELVAMLVDTIYRMEDPRERRALLVEIRKSERLLVG